MVVVLRTVNLLVAGFTALLIAVVAADSRWEFAALFGVIVVFWAAYLIPAWANPRRLVIGVSILFAVALSGVAAQNLLWIEHVGGFKISNKLDLSPRLIQSARRQQVYSNAWMQFGDDPLFYRRVPGSTYHERYDYRNVGPEYTAVVDQNGYLNPGLDYYGKHRTIDVFLAGDSVLEGVGNPGVITDLAPAAGRTIYSLSTGSYSPRQKVRALETFALPKRPRLLLIEFFAGNDASEIIEDTVCEGLQRGYECRFDYPTIAEALQANAEYASLGDYGDFSPLMRTVRQVRTDSWPLALGAGVAAKFRSYVQETPLRRRVDHFEGEALTPPGFSHYSVRQEQRIRWIKKGLALTDRTYDQLLKASADAGARVAILYNPTSYEIYRRMLPEGLHDVSLDAISDLQRSHLSKYAADRGVTFCDLTDEYRARVQAGERRLFGVYDGTHWSDHGRSVAAGMILSCIQRNFPVEAVGDDSR
jgi:hypothetical protein